mgnify:CR=1 FL=1
MNPPGLSSRFPAYSEHSPVVPVHCVTPDAPGTIHRFVGKIVEKTGPQTMKVAVRNRILVGDAVEILTKKGPAVQDRVISMIDKKGLDTAVAQPNTVVTMTLSRDYEPLDLIRHAEEMTYTGGRRSGD